MYTAVYVSSTFQYPVGTMETGNCDHDPKTGKK